MQTYLPPPDASVPGVTQFRADMATIGKTSEVDGNSAAGWLAVDLVATAAQGLATVDRASLLRALGSISSYDGGGMIPPTDFSKAAPLPNFPRLFNTSFSTAVLQNGQFQVEPKLEPFIPFFKAAG
jgi:branched-chain amino acid transport system substrate-binding protein